MPALSPEQASLDGLDTYHNPVTLYVSGVFAALTTIFAIFRVVSRFIKRAPWGWDDYLIIPAFIFNLSVPALAISIWHVGKNGAHLPYVMASDPENFVRILKGTYALCWTYLPSIFFSKMSLLCLYHRIFPRKKVRVATYLTMAFVTGNFVSFLTYEQVQCIPFDYQWDKSIKGGYCTNQQLAFELVNVVHIVTDVLMIALPIWPLRDLQVSTARKVGLGCIFLTACVGTVATILRLVSFVKYPIDKDFPWYGNYWLSWTIVETSLCFIAACIPVTAPVWGFLIPDAVKAWVSEATHTIASNLRTSKPHADRRSHFVARPPKQSDGSHLLEGQKGWIELGEMQNVASEHTKGTSTARSIREDV